MEEFDLLFVTGFCCNDNELKPAIGHAIVVHNWRNCFIGSKIKTFSRAKTQNTNEIANQNAIANKPANAMASLRCPGGWLFLGRWSRSFLTSFLRSFLTSFLKSCLRYFLRSFLKSFLESFLRSFLSSGGWLFLGWSQTRGGRNCDRVAK